MAAKKKVQDVERLRPYVLAHLAGMARQTTAVQDEIIRGQIEPLFPGEMSRGRREFLQSRTVDYLVYMEGVIKDLRAVGCLRLPKNKLKKKSK